METSACVRARRDFSPTVLVLSVSRKPRGIEVCSIPGRYCFDGDEGGLLISHAPARALSLSLSLSLSRREIEKLQREQLHSYF